MVGTEMLSLLVKVFYLGLVRNVIGCQEDELEWFQAQW